MRITKLSPRALAPLAMALLLPAVLGGPENRVLSRMDILSDEWQLAGFDNSLDLSGIAAANGTQCLIGSDEEFYVQPGVIDLAKKRIESGRLIALPVQPDAKGKMEADIEGVTFSKEDQAYYVVGSHGLGKKKGDFQPGRHSVYKIPVDPATGMVRKDRIQRSSLLPWLEKTPLLEPYVRKPLQQNGLNIEGLTCAKGRLYFGLRAPNQDGHGLVIELSPRDLFNGEPKELEVHEIAIPKGRGIREIAAVRDGFVLLTGNASAEASKKIPFSMAAGPDVHFDVLFWDGGDSTKTTRIGSLPQNGGKAEALLVLNDSADAVDMLVIFDGLTGGAPLAVRLHR